LENRKYGLKRKTSMPDKNIEAKQFGFTTPVIPDRLFLNRACVRFTGKRIVSGRWERSIDKK
jgi:hypothetical protein